MILERCLHPVERAIASSTLVPRDGVVVVAVSGGADSMALAEALRYLGAGSTARSPLMSSRENCSIVSYRAAEIASSGHRPLPLCVVAHFDHRLREDSARDAEHVEAYARSHGLEFVLGSEDVARRARARRSSIEEAARDARYEFLSATAERFGAVHVATAHTRSDQIETILMRILRGTGRGGVAGIPAERGAFVRPLLEIARADTRDYCETRGVTFVDDPSNQDTRFLRNRIRLETLPELRAVFPSIDESLLAIADAARREQRAFETRTAGWLRANFSEEESGVWTLRLAGFDSIDDDDATALLREALAHAGCAHDVGRAHYERLLGLVRSVNAGPAVDLPGFSARREHDALVLRSRGSCRPLEQRVAPMGADNEQLQQTLRVALRRGPRGLGRGVAKRQDPQRSDAVLLTVPGRSCAGDWIIETDYVSTDDACRAIASREAGGDVAYFDAAAIALPLVARPIRPGDAMRPFGLGGRKKLSDLFVDRKVPRRRRERLIVIEGTIEGESIYWVPGVATSEQGRIGDATARVIRLKARRSDREGGQE